MTFPYCHLTRSISAYFPTVFYNYCTFFILPIFSTVIVHTPSVKWKVEKFPKCHKNQSSYQQLSPISLELPDMNIYWSFIWCQLIHFVHQFFTTILVIVILMLVPPDPTFIVHLSTIIWHIRLCTVLLCHLIPILWHISLVWLNILCITHSTC